jgi:hypothetical protein
MVSSLTHCTHIVPSWSLEVLNYRWNLYSLCESLVSNALIDHTDCINRSRTFLFKSYANLMVPLWYYKCVFSLLGLNSADLSLHQWASTEFALANYWVNDLIVAYLCPGGASNQCNSTWPTYSLPYWIGLCFRIHCSPSSSCKFEYAYTQLDESFI